MPLRIWCSDLCGRNKQIWRTRKTRKFVRFFLSSWQPRGLDSSIGSSHGLQNLKPRNEPMTNIALLGFKLLSLLSNCFHCFGHFLCHLAILERHRHRANIYLTIHVYIYISYLWLLVNLEQLRKGANKSQPVNGR